MIVAIYVKFYYIQNICTKNWLGTCDVKTRPILKYPKIPGPENIFYN